MMKKIKSLLGIKEKTPYDPPMIHKILVELYTKNVVDEDQIVFNYFLIPLWRKGTDEGNNDLDRIERSLQKLLNKGYITKSTNLDIPNIGATASLNKTFNGTYVDLYNTNVQVGLTQEGYYYINNELNQQELRRSVIRTNLFSRVNAGAAIIFGLVVTILQVTTCISLRSPSIQQKEQLNSQLQQYNQLLKQDSIENTLLRQLIEKTTPCASAPSPSSSPKGASKKK